MEIGVNDEIIHAHATMDAAVLIAIFILITVSFMSITGGLMVTLPLILANAMAFAYMAFMDIGITINTLPVAAVGLGIGDNFCIYLYSRCQEEIRLQGGIGGRRSSSRVHHGQGSGLHGLTIHIANTHLVRHLHMNFRQRWASFLPSFWGQMSSLP